MQIELWHQICNMRTTLLHLQFLACEIEQKTELQNERLERAHKDRIIQLYQLKNQLSELEEANIRKILIVKLQQILSLHQKHDEQLWNQNILDSFLSYVSHVRESVLENITRVYIGNGAMIDIRKCEASLKHIEDKATMFLIEQSKHIEDYNGMIDQINLMRIQMEKYMKQMVKVASLVRENYGQHLKKKVFSYQKKIEKNIESFKKSLIEG